MQNSECTYTYILLNYDKSMMDR